MIDPTSRCKLCPIRVIVQFLLKWNSSDWDLRLALGRLESIWAWTVISGYLGLHNDDDAFYICVVSLSGLFPINLAFSGEIRFCSPIHGSHEW